MYRLEAMTGSPRKVRYDHVLACQQLTAADARLAKLMARSGPFGLRLKPTHSTFEALLESIVYQQLHGRAAKAIHGRILDLFPDATPTPQALLRLKEDVLRTAGLSAGKQLAIRDLAEKSVAGIVPPLAKLHRMADEEICDAVDDCARNRNLDSANAADLPHGTAQRIARLRLRRPQGICAYLWQASSGNAGHAGRSS